MTFAEKTHEVPFKGRVSLAQVQLADHPSGSDPICECTHQEGLAVLSACDKGLKATVAPCMFTVIVELCGVFLKPRPSNRLLNGKGPELAFGNLVPQLDLFKVSLFHG